MGSQWSIISSRSTAEIVYKEAVLFLTLQVQARNTAKDLKHLEENRQDMHD